MGCGGFSFKMKGKKLRQGGKTVRNGLHPGPLSSLTLPQENILYVVQDDSHLTGVWKKNSIIFQDYFL